MKQVYFLHAPSVHLVKIGVSGDPERRFSEIGLISPVPVVVWAVVDGGHDVEADYHRRFSHLRHHGEWFHATAELLNAASSDGLMGAWNRASPEARQEFLRRVDRPVMDRAGWK